WAPEPGESLAVERLELERELDRLPEADRAALELAGRRIRAFHELQTYADLRGPQGLELLTRPVRRAGVYVPGGRAAYPSTVLMCAIPARLAGVREVLLATPPAADGSVLPAVLAAAAIAGVDQAFTDLLRRLDRAEVVSAAHCSIVLSDSMEQAMEVANAFGPEHLEIVAEAGERLLELVENAGAVFLGPHAPVSLGDYVIG